MFEYGHSITQNEKIGTNILSVWPIIFKWHSKKLIRASCAVNNESGTFCSILCYLKNVNREIGYMAATPFFHPIFFQVL